MRPKTVTAAVMVVGGGGVGDGAGGGPGAGGGSGDSQPPATLSASLRNPRLLSFNQHDFVEGDQTQSRHDG